MMGIRSGRIVLAALLAVGLAFAVELAAQGRAAPQVAGRVTDVHGAPLPQAQVVISSLGRGTLTDGEGRFAFWNLPPGRHRLEVLLIGYAPARLVILIPSAGGREEVDLSLAATPLSLPGLHVTGTAVGRNPQAVTQSTTQLSGRGLERELGATIAHTLASQPGIAVRYNGPGASLPVIRGLTGDRILVLRDGLRTADLSGSADDHGLTIDPLAAQRLEVVRGPATLMYGNNALGGVVNVISDDMPSSVPQSTRWMAAAQTETAHPGASGNLRLSAPLGESWALTTRLAARQAGDVRIGNDPVLGDRLANTDLRSWDTSLGLGYVRPQVTAGAALKAYGFAYGLPVPPESDPISLRGNRYEASARAEVALPQAAFPSLRADLTLQDYGHDELDELSGELQMSFGLRTQAANLLLRQAALGPFTDGAWGISGLLKQYAPTGAAALTPPAAARTFGIFAFQELALGAGPALEAGARFDHYGIASADNAKFGPAVERTFRAFSGSLGLRAPLAPGVTASFSLARSFRAPTVEELFSAAPHAGTGAVEFGDPTLAAEHGRSVEGVLRFESARWHGQLAAYSNVIASYIHLVARGDTLIEAVRLPVFAYAQDDVRLRGVEAAVERALRDDLVLGMTADAVRAEHADGAPLSFMPAPRLGALLRWDNGTFSLGGDMHHEFAQERVGSAEELPTPAHTLLRLHAGVRLLRGGTVHSLSLRGENLTNELHREATSRIKDFAPGPGRNIALVYRVFF